MLALPLLVAPLSSSSSHNTLRKCNPSSVIPIKSKRTNKRAGETVIVMASSSEDNLPQITTKLVTFLGKGGSGKTTSAVFAAQHYATAGLNTCLVVHSQDPTPEYLLNCKIGTSPTICRDNLSAVKLETTKMLLEPLNRVKQADARLNTTQGVLQGVVGEELGVLPGMDSIFSVVNLERFVRFLGNMGSRNDQQNNFDIIIYDGISTEETLRMVSAASRARLYLKYIRNIVDKTDFGRLAGPSLLRLVDEGMSLSGGGSNRNGRMSAEIWDKIDRSLERGSAAFSDPSKFGCYLVMDPSSQISVNCALRYWGCTIQAGAQISGAFGISPPTSSEELAETVKNNFSPLSFALIPRLSMDSPLDWNAIMRDDLSREARNILSVPASIMSSVKFDSLQKAVTLLMPGFNKSEIRLYQYRGGSELLVEAGDQRRVIVLPPEIRGRVGGAKFMDRNLVITIR